MTAALAYDLTPSPSETITVASDLFGTLTVRTDSLFTIPKGVLGFPECRLFVLLPSERPHVHWMQAVESPRLAFLVVEPFACVDAYTIDLHTPDIAALVSSPDRAMVLAIVTLPSSGEGVPTANLQGPVVLDLPTRTGAQVVLPDGPYSVREPIGL
jgi:flagellar assembly factor FliW